ncbi:MAG: hypothetical protein KDA57_04435 [Planctomycetales bacterium]|nr:hypothetical protein [Planctomycetales bacterium]
MKVRDGRSLAILVLCAWAMRAVSAGEPVDNWRALQIIARQVPQEGVVAVNVFLENEIVSVSVAGVEGATGWLATDERGADVARGTVEESDQGRVEIGNLGIGWYRVTWLDEEGASVGWTTAAVLARLAAPVPQDSPICVDSATAWFARDDEAKQLQFAQLASLAGVNWVRDRISWRDIQPTPDRFINETTYDSAAAIQARYGLKILQVHHDTPQWAETGGGGTGRFPGDLRAAYSFGKAMSARFAGKVLAWEPWNEANVATFGGHTMDEICSLQKAAYLGIKAGNPEVTVCWNVTTGVPTARQTECVLENETWPYFDTYNVHTYDWPDAYELLWGPVREAACGKPIWVTESDRGIASESDSPTRDLSPANAILKAQFIAQSYASSLHAGANRHFHFILGQYGERDIQFGLLRHDLTPRPSYVALAAVGRMLAGAHCLGRYLVEGQPDVHLIAFRGQPNGAPRDVLVAWVERPGDWPVRGKGETQWPLPKSLRVEECYDYLGRMQGKGSPAGLSSAPIFAALPLGECDQLALQTPRKANVREGSAAPIVLQCLLPKEQRLQDTSIRWAGQFEHAVPLETETEVPIFAYNFSDREVAGQILLEGFPANCEVSLDRWEVRLPPMGRQLIPFHVKLTKQAVEGNGWIKLRGEFGDAGRPVLAFRLVAEQ